jgi:membrane fusion protein (multidrug efflux system)
MSHVRPLPSVKADASIVEAPGDMTSDLATRLDQPAAPGPKTDMPVSDRRALASDVTPSGNPQAARLRRRSRMRGILMLGGIAIVVVAAGIFWLGGGRIISADDAYVRAAKLMVSTDVSGIVSSVEVKQGQTVKAGDVLFRVDPRQFEIALASARANLAQVGLTLAAAQQDYKRLQSDIAAQSAQVQLARSNFERGTQLMAANAGTRASYDLTRFTLEAAERTLDSLKQQSQVALTRLGGSADTPVEKLPQYMQARAQVDEAQRQLDHTTVRAPFNGIVTAVDSLQPGTFLVSQTAALTNTGAVGLVSNERMWVEANLKETDLTHAQSGNPVEVTIDSFPDHVWHGHVESIFPASGAEFSILPAQNASGNWVKVVQRIPVHIALDRQPDDPPLRAGMSAVVEVDTGHKRSWSDLWPSWLPRLGGGTRIASAGRTSSAEASPAHDRQH